MTMRGESHTWQERRLTGDRKRGGKLAGVPDAEFQERVGEYQKLGR